MKKILLTLVALLTLASANALTPFSSDKLAKMNVQIATSNNKFAGSYATSPVYLNDNTQIKITNWCGFFDNFGYSELQEGVAFGNIQANVNWSAGTVQIPPRMIYYYQDFVLNSDGTDYQYDTSGNPVVYQAYFVVCPATVASSSNSNDILNASALQGTISDTGMKISTGWDIGIIFQLSSNIGQYYTNGAFFGSPMKTNIMFGNGKMTYDVWDINEDTGMLFKDQDRVTVPVYVDDLGEDNFYVYNFCGISSRPQFDVVEDEPGTLYNIHQIMSRLTDEEGNEYKFRLYNWKRTSQGYLDADDQNYALATYTKNLNVPNTDGYHKISFGNMCLVDPDALWANGIYGDIVLDVDIDLDLTMPRLKGDVNMDGVVSVNDVTTLIAYILGDDPQPIDLAEADFDQDGDIAIVDVTKLINYILGEEQ